MKIERKIEAIEFALNWVDAYDAFDSQGDDEDKLKKDSEAYLMKILADLRFEKMVQEVAAQGRKDYPHASAEAIRKAAVKACRDAMEGNK
jgi:hypothetical protein